MVKEGSEKVPIAGVDDKRQITAVFGATMDGIFFPPQLIYQGKSPKCLPEIRFPEEWDITYTENHWSNEETTIQYIHNIILPFIHKQKTVKKLLPDQRALCIFDNFNAQLTSDVLQLLKDSFIDSVFVPANCTDQLQPLDLIVSISQLKIFSKENLKSGMLSRCSLTVQKHLLSSL